MKKIIIASVFVVLVFACSHKTIPSSEKTTAVNTNTGSTKIDTVTAEPITQGKIVYTTRCNRCHGLKVVENYTADRWTNILKIMIQKARLDDTQAQQVTAYVMANAKK